VFCAAAMAIGALNSAASMPPAPESSAPVIEFLKDRFDPDGIGFMSQQADESGVDLDVSGLRAIDKNVAFLFGDVRVAAGTIRSCLLRTSDGGKSWHEVMSPELGSDLTHVAFSDPQHGWALAQWSVEGPGAILLFGSADGGRTWRQLAQIPVTPSHAAPVDGQPWSMTFTTALKGEIELVYDTESVDDPGIEIEVLASDDGGMTWKLVRHETRKLPAVETPAVETPAAEHDRGFDSTDWELVTGGLGDPIAIRRYDREQRHWSVTTLPTHFQYKRGRVLTSPEN